MVLTGLVGGSLAFGSSPQCCGHMCLSCVGANPLGDPHGPLDGGANVFQPEGHADVAVCSHGCGECRILFILS